LRASRRMRHTDVLILATHCARGLQISSAPKRGRREDRVHAAPAVSCASCTKENAHEHTGSAEAIRPSLRNGFTAYFVLSPVTGLFATVASVMPGHHRQLDASVGASGPHDFAVRISTIRQLCRSRPPQPVPTSVTMANAPSCGTGCTLKAGDLPPKSSNNSENPKFL
jgi:hypothetical protein